MKLSGITSESTRLVIRSDIHFEINVSNLRRPTATHLYKYGKLTEPDRLRKILIENTLYFPTSEELNDPTECLPTLADQPIDEILDCLCEQFKADNPSASSEQLEKIRAKGRSLGKETLMKEMRRLLNKMMERRYGILSLSKRKDSLPLWAHYAGEHTGYCLEFRNDREFATGYEVLYREKIPLRLSSEIDAYQADFLFTKRTDWAYEEEVRILVKPPGPQQFSPELLESVMLGKDVAAENRKIVLEWALKRATPVKVLQATFNQETQHIEYLRPSASGRRGKPHA